MIGKLKDKCFAAEKKTVRSQKNFKLNSRDDVKKLLKHFKFYYIFKFEAVKAKELPQ